MKNIRGILMLVVALLTGLSSVVFASRWMRERAQSVEQVVVAAVDINMGEKLNQDMFTTIAWPSSSLPPNTFSDVQKLDGRVTRVNMQAGEPVLASKLAPEGASGGLSAVISEGKRAMTVRVNDVVGVAGFALPGNFVDVIMNTNNEVGQGEARHIRHISKTVLEHILVLAVAQEADRDETKPKVVNAVTLELTPKQAEILDLARSVGNLSLVLRNQSDIASADTQGITKEALLAWKEEQIPAVEEAPVVVPPTPVTKVKRAAVVEKRCVSVMTGLVETKECF